MHNTCDISPCALLQAAIAINLKGTKMSLKADDVYVWSAIIAIAIVGVASLVAYLLSPTTLTVPQSMPENIIRLDGVLFGFSGAMLGLFIGKLEKVSKKFLFRCLTLALASFWCYIFSIAFTFFLYMNLGEIEWVFVSIILTLAGTICSSVYPVLLFAKEQELSVQKQKGK